MLMLLKVALYHSLLFFFCDLKMDQDFFYITLSLCTVCFEKNVKWVWIKRISIRLKLP